MNKKRFFDNRLKYLSFIQNTDEKSKISEEIYPFIKKLPKKKEVVIADIQMELFVLPTRVILI